MERAKLYFRYGAMNCGKSAHLLMTAHNYEEQGMKVVVFKAVKDTKGEDYVVTRLGSSRKVDYLVQDKDNLIDIVKHNFNDVSCILVDEAQFLSEKQAEQLLMITVQLTIPIIAYGLRTDAFLNPWSGSARLLQLADSIEEMKTICKCGRKATFVIRQVNGQDTFVGSQLAIDGENQVTYESVCKNCYFERQENKN